MGAAAYRRGSNSIRAGIDAEIAGARRDNTGRVAVWTSLLNKQCILHFKGSTGDVVAGPIQTAVPTDRPKFSLRRFGTSRWAGTWDDNARGIAMRIVEQVGRKRPYRVTCPGD